MVVLTEDESGLRCVEDEIPELANEVVEGFPDVPLAHHLLEQVRQQAGGHLPEHKEKDDEFKCRAYHCNVADPDPYWIRIQSGQWIRIRIRKPDPGQK